MVTLLKELKKFPWFNERMLEVKPKKHTEEPLVPQDEILSLIFAPDPVTGVPRSDLAVIMSKDKSPEVAQYIQDTLMRPLPDSQSCGDDADFALKSVKDRRETTDQYITRLRELAQPFHVDDAGNVAS